MSTEWMIFCEFESLIIMLYNKDYYLQHNNYIVVVNIWLLSGMHTSHIIQCALLGWPLL